jgi:hypothetical protein
MLSISADTFTPLSSFAYRVIELASLLGASTIHRPTHPFGSAKYLPQHELVKVGVYRAGRLRWDAAANLRERNQID